MVRTDKLKLTLLQNAYDYLNAAIECVVDARRDNDQRLWKFAILHIAICIELLLKERLRREHPLLVYANIDKYRPITQDTKSVSWGALVERLKYVLGEDFRNIDAGRLRLTQRLRNQIIHYKVFFEFPSIYHDFANLHNFILQFFEKFIRESEEEELRDHINSDLWLEEQGLVYAFSDQITYFNEQFMTLWLSDAIRREQKRTELLIHGKAYKRIRYGDTKEKSPGSDFDYASEPCGDCSVIRGQVHLLECDMERCPRCAGQLITCGCHYQYPDSVVLGPDEVDKDPTGA